MTEKLIGQKGSKSTILSDFPNIRSIKLVTDQFRILFLIVSLDIRDNYGFDAAYWAKEGRHKEIMDLLPNAKRITKEELVEHVKAYWAAHGIKAGGGGKKKKKGGKKKK